jgi:hypothetical protein
MHDLSIEQHERSIENLGRFAKLFRHYKGCLPTGVECRLYLKDLQLVLSSLCFSDSADVAPLALWKPDHVFSSVSQFTATKYLLRQLLFLATRIGNEFIDRVDSKGEVHIIMNFKVIFVLMMMIIIVLTFIVIAFYYNQ